MLFPLRHVSLAVVLSVACASSVARRAGAQDTRPRLLVFVTIDQLRPDYLQRFDQQLTGGFRRLLDGGAVFLDGYQDHAITETAPGHAATLSGRFPVRTGIAFNAQGVNDVPNADVLGAPEEPPASPARFRGTTLIDWIRAADPRARVLSVSRKDRGAILPVGRSRAPVFWWAPSNGTFTTSRYYADSLPAWVQRFNARQIAQRRAGSAWSLLLPDTAYREPDSVATENRGRAFVFPHVAPDDSATAARVAGAFPWMDEMTLALALEGLTELELGRANDRTDVLAVSLSTTDAIGHAYGPDSREMHDNILRLDRALGVFFDSLFALRDSGRVVVALTSDHGVSPLPGSKSAVDANSDAAVVSLAEPFSRFRKRLAARRVDSLAVALVEGLVVVTNPTAFARAKVDPDSAIATFGADAIRVKGVLRADLFTALAGADTVQDAVARRWLHMFAPGGAVRMAVTLTPFSYWAPASYPTHGSPHDADARVPILFYGAGVRPGRAGTTARVVDIAPTLAAILGVKPVEQIDGRLLERVVQ